MKTLIFGHKKPDTDAVMSAIGLSYLKNQLGENTEARVLGSINKETEYALDYFNVKTPKYLNDVKLQLKDVNYHKNFYINENASIYDAYQEMLKEELTGIPVVKDNGVFSGLITLKELSHIIINENIEDISLIASSLKERIVSLSSTLNISSLINDIGGSKSGLSFNNSLTLGTI